MEISNNFPGFLEVILKGFVEWQGPLLVNTSHWGIARSDRFPFLRRRLRL